MANKINLHGHRRNFQTTSFSFVWLCPGNTFEIKLHCHACLRGKWVINNIFSTTSMFYKFKAIIVKKILASSVEEWWKCTNFILIRLPRFNLSLSSVLDNYRFCEKHYLQLDETGIFLEMELSRHRKSSRTKVNTKMTTTSWCSTTANTTCCISLQGSTQVLTIPSSKKPDLLQFLTKLKPQTDGLDSQSVIKSACKVQSTLKIFNSKTEKKWLHIP